MEPLFFPVSTDEFNTVINSQETYDILAAVLFHPGSAFIAWTDGDGTQFDILFAYDVHFGTGPYQGGVRRTDLFVAIMRKGAFGFELEDTDTHKNYYAEKLNLDPSGSDSQKIADLINGVKISLKKIFEGKGKNGS